jgi:MipA family protein
LNHGGMTLPARHPRSVTRILPCAVALAISQSSHAEEDDQKGTSTHNYLVGAMALSQPEYEGSERRIIKLRPLWAYQWGRFRLSTSRSAAAMNFASDPQGPGASALLVDGNRFRFGGALRFDSGRQSGDSPRLIGLPDIERTLRGRVFVGYKLSDRWDVSANVSQDLLGRQGGAVGSLDLGYHKRLGDNIVWSAGLGMSFANRQNMQTYFGITPEQSATSKLPVFMASSGLRNVYVGTGFITSLTPRWILFGNAGASRLLGDAAASPLTGQQSSVSAGLGLAYRCCRW